MASFSKTSNIHDATITRMRAGRNSWDAIARACGVPNRQQIIDRAKIIGVPPMPPSEAEIEEAAERRALPSGSDASWGAINAGLSLAGEAYPHEAFAL